jgi:hypothetical protein
VTLVEAKATTYPGTSQPASFEGWLRVQDAAQGESLHRAAMNQPLHYRGYVFFLASIGATGKTSTFLVTGSPGLPLVYVGSALVAAGVLWMLAGRSGPRWCVGTDPGSRVAPARSR